METTINVEAKNKFCQEGIVVENDIIKQLRKDRKGLIKQGNELKGGIAELHRRLLMVQGALKYVNQILETLKEA